MAEHTGQERTEQATPKRLSDAKKKGEVLRSRELTIFLSLVAAALSMLAMGKSIISGLKVMVANGLKIQTEEAFVESMILTRLHDILLEAVVLLSPFLLLITFSLAIAPTLLGGVVFNFTLVAPKFERIDPFKGLKKIFSSNGLMELFKAMAKFVLVAATVILVFSIVLEDVLRLASIPLGAAFSNSGNLFLWCFIAFSSALLLVVAMDVPFQIWSFNKKLKMTKQEVKDEMKDTDGRPEVKSAIREKQQEMSQNRMIAEVPTADVVITNPTHYAIALRYEDNEERAPIVVAKGKNLVAANIREVARANNVMLFSAPPLARALYFTTELNQEIPGNLFLAVAQVLAYVFQMREFRGGQKKPVAPRNLPVPDEYQALINNENTTRTD